MDPIHDHCPMAPVKRVREKRCDLCEETADTLYRVRVDGSGRWVFLCAACQARAARDNPHYTYGGTWKSRKRH